MTSSPQLSPVSQRVLLGLGLLSALGTLTYGLAYVIALPRVTPGMLVSGSFETLTLPLHFELIQASSVLLYAFCLLPVIVMLSIRQYATNPLGIVIAGSASCLSAVMEIFNNLPVWVKCLYPGKGISPPPEMIPFLKQTAWIKYVSFDVAAFTIAFAAGLLYAALLYRKSRALAFVYVGSVLVFLLHLPFLWMAPAFAVFLMGLSICIAACGSVIMAKLAIE